MGTHTADIERLATYRLRRGLSFAELEGEMHRAGYPVPQRSLHLYVTKGIKPHDPTLFKIREFLASLRKRRARGKRAKARRVAA